MVQCGGLREDVGICKHIRDQVENQTAREVVLLDETANNNEANFKTATESLISGITPFALKCPASSVRRAPSFGKAGERVESNEQRVRVTDQAKYSCKEGALIAAVLGWAVCWSWPARIESEPKALRNLAENRGSVEWVQ